MSLTLDTTEMEQRIAERVVREVSRLLAAKPEPANATNGDRWMSLREISALVGRSKRTLNDMEKRKEFPRHSTILKGSKMWRESVVMGWMAEREQGQ